MTKIEELERELQLQKELEKSSYIEKQLASESKWIGKCFSSHLFERIPKVGKEITLRKITNVVWDKHDEIINYEGLNITFRFWPTRNAFKVEIQDYATRDTPFPSWISSFSHEISEEVFNRIQIEVQAHAETYFDKIRAIFKQNEYISMGDHSDECSKINLLEKQGFQFIELPTEGYPNIKDILAWNNHPFLYGANKLLYTKESMELIPVIADKIEENAQGWGGSIWERDSPRIAALRKFYQKNVIK